MKREAIQARMGPSPNFVRDVLYDIVTIDIIPLLVLIATIVFMIGVIRYITSGANQEQRKRAEMFIVFGIVGLAVIITFWGFVRLLVITFQIESPPIPLGTGEIQLYLRIPYAYEILHHVLAERGGQDTIREAIMPSIEGFFVDLIDYALSLIPLILVVASAIFIWGIIKYVSAGDDEEKIKQGRNYMVYGVIAFFFMITVWGIVALFVYTFQFEGFPIPRMLPPQKNAL